MKPMSQPAVSSPTVAGTDLTLWAPVAVIAVSVTALATAYVAQYGYGLEPCVLCLVQRVPFAVAILLGATALYLRQSGSTSAVAWLLGGAALAFLAGGGVALYHVGVEQHWWESAVCGGALPTLNIEDLQAALLAPPPKSCDVIDWTFLGLSMARWNAMVSPVLAIATGLAARAVARGSR